LSSARSPALHTKRKLCLTSYTFTPKSWVKCFTVLTRDPRDPFTFVDPWPMTRARRWPIVCSDNDDDKRSINLLLQQEHKPAEMWHRWRTIFSRCATFYSQPKRTLAVVANAVHWTEDARLLLYHLLLKLSIIFVIRSRLIPMLNSIHSVKHVHFSHHCRFRNVYFNAVNFKRFSSASALLAMHRAVIARGIPLVRLTRSSIVSRGMNIRSWSFQCLVGQFL